MRAALGLARRALGNCWPNPAVGCLIVKDGVTVGRGWTQPGGRPHAETVALEQAGALAKGATAYVTLEPCDHHGKTGPCSDALVEAGVARVVGAIEDPDPRVCGAGFKTLREAGVDVVEGVLSEEAGRLNRGYLLRVTAGRPLFTLKTATTLDGRIAADGGKSKWITGPSARRRGHRMRDSHDAVMTGMGTVLADDPELTCRLPGLPVRAPVRVVLDSRGRLPAGSRLVQSAESAPLWVVTAAPDALPEAIRKAAEIVEAPAGPDGRLDLVAVAALLAEKGLTRVLAEGGGELAASLLKADLVDRIAWFRAPGIMGGEGLAAVAGLPVAAPDGAPRFARRGVETLDEDILELYDRRSEKS